MVCVIELIQTSNISEIMFDNINHVSIFLMMLAINTSIETDLSQRLNSPFNATIYNINQCIRSELCYLVFPIRQMLFKLTNLSPTRSDNNRIFRICWCDVDFLHLQNTIEFSKFQKIQHQLTLLCDISEFIVHNLAIIQKC